MVRRTMYHLIVFFNETQASGSTATSAASSLLPTTFTFELTTYPTALLETVDLLLEPQKSSLADEIWNMTRDAEAEAEAVV